MDVDGPAARRVEHDFRQDLAERDDDGDVCAERAETLGPSGITQSLRLQDGKTRGERALLHRRRRQPLSAMRGPIGLRDDGDDLVVTQECVERGKREAGRAVEEHPHPSGCL